MVQNFQLTPIITTVLVIAIIFTAVGSFYIGGASQYGASDLNVTTMNKIINYSNDINTISNETGDQLLSLQTQESVLDKLGLFFSQTYDGIKIAGRSMGIVSDMSSDGISQIPSMGSGFTKTFNTMVGLIVFVILFVGILMAVIFKWQT
jgi:hypothetical protein